MLPPQPTYTYDLESTDPAEKRISKVRLHIPDRVEPFFFDDVELQAFLDDNAKSVKYAAADALEAAATDEAFVQKVQTTLGVSSDGAKTADVILKRAESLRKQAKRSKDDEDDDSYSGIAGWSSISPYGGA